MLTIGAKGTRLGINQAAFEALGTPRAAQLFYDPQGRRIGIRGCHQRNKRACPILSDGKGGWYIQQQGFAAYFGISISQTRHYAATSVRGCLIVDVNIIDLEVRQ